MSPIRDGIPIAEECVIGAGTVIKDDTDPGDIYSVERAHPPPRRDCRDDAEL
jgi:tetrahydrodipicolinate N-succinyltransferase